MIYLYKQNIIDALKALTDYDYQRIAWFPNNQNLMYSFNENAEDLFYSSGLDEALRTIGEIVFGIAADDALRELEAIVDKIDGHDYSEEVLIDMPAMQTIRKKAKHALFLVQTSTGEGSTVTMLEPGMAPPA